MQNVNVHDARMLRICNSDVFVKGRVIEHIIALVAREARQAMACISDRCGGDPMRKKKKKVNENYCTLSSFSSPYFW